MKFELFKRSDSINSELDLFRKSIRSVFDDFLGISQSELFEGSTLPAIDLEEDQNGYYLKAELPGVDEKDLKLEVEKNMLVLSGSKKIQKKEESAGRRSIISETVSSSFYRTIGLPGEIDPEGIRAEYRNGVVSVVVPKAGDQKKRNITISVQ